MNVTKKLSLWLLIAALLLSTLASCALPDLGGLIPPDDGKEQDTLTPPALDEVVPDSLTISIAKVLLMVGETVDLDYDSDPAGIVNVVYEATEGASHVRIEGVDDSYGFTFYHWNELEGKRRRDWKSGWYSHWQGGYLRRYSVFTPEYYSYDIDIYGKPLKADYEKGEPRFWAANVGEDVVRALKDISSGETVPTNVIQSYEFLHTKCMVKAGYRLAALLNDIFK